jgi:hypothetical protein
MVHLQYFSRGCEQTWSTLMHIMTHVMFHLFQETVKECIFAFGDDGIHVSDIVLITYVVPPYFLHCHLFPDLLFYKSYALVKIIVLLQILDE